MCFIRTALDGRIPPGDFKLAASSFIVITTTVKSRKDSDNRLQVVACLQGKVALAVTVAAPWVDNQ